MRAEAGVTLVYAGRFRPQLPAGPVVLDDREVLPRQLHQALAGSERLVVLDALSFPYESLDDDEWDLPMALALPPGLSLDDRRALLGPPVLSRLGCNDLVADGAAAGWDAVADEFVLPRGQFLAVGEGAALVAHVLAGVPPRLGTRTAKAAFRAEADAVAAAAGRPGGAGSRALVVGCGRGAWAQGLARLGYAPVSFDLDPEALEEARRHFPGLVFHQFDGEGGPEGAPDATGLALFAEALTRLDLPGRARALGRAWAGLRPGGLLVVVDRLIGEAGEPGWMAAGEVVAAVSEASAGAAALEDVRVLRTGSGGLRRTGLLAFRRPGGEG